MESPVEYTPGGSGPPLRGRWYDARLMRRGLDELLGESEGFVGLLRQLRELVGRYAAARRMPPLLLLGETGTGKTMIARALHDEGPRSGRPFVDVNCAAIPETLMEAEMFGYERGAFTDARLAKAGLFMAADRGTIFLDEIGLLPEMLQAKLLKVVEEQQLRPLGSTTSKLVDVWIIAATSEDLEAAVRKRRFREDLYHRLAVVTLRVPPLRQRAEDVVLLARHLLARACADYGLPTKAFTSEALVELRAYQWPGNIRELGNVVERVALLWEALDIPASALGLAHGRSTAAPGSGRAARPRAPVDESAGAGEHDRLIEALTAAGGNVSRAAESLGLTRNTLRYRLRKLAGDAHVPLAAPASSDTTPAPSSPARWERRRLAFLRVAVTPASAEPLHQAGRVVKEVTEKIAVFGGTVDGVSPLGVTAVFGFEPAEDVLRRAAQAATAIRKLFRRPHEADSPAPSAKLAVHDMHALLWRGSWGVHLDMAARQEIWRTLDGLIRRVDHGCVILSDTTAASLRASSQLTDARDAHGDACVLLGGEPRTSRSGPRVFVGRQAEMAMLHRRLALVREGRGQVITIGGEPGIGKSRMLFEFHRTLAPDEAAYLSARAVSYGRTQPLLPIIELMCRAHGIEDDDPPAAILAKLRSALATLGLPADQMTPYLSRLIGRTAGIDSLVREDPETVHQRTIECVRDVVLAASRARPLVIAIEDLHWMDRASERYMETIVDALVEAPILLLTTQRPGQRAPWSDRSYVAELKLLPLGRADARQVLGAALRQDDDASRLHPATAEAILDRAEGNPFFIEELARAMPEAPAATTPVPDSIEAVLLARMDRLPESSKMVLQAASVLGRDVPLELLRAISSEVSEPEDRLDELHRLEYLHLRSRTAQAHYRFKHALTQEVAYGSLLPPDRRALHARVVEVVEQRYADRLDDHVETLAHHALGGELWRSAVDYLRRAGRKAARRFAHHEAVACYEQALPALARLPEGSTVTEAVDIRIDLFVPLMALGEYRRCLAHCVDAATIAESLGDRLRIGRALAACSLMLRLTNATDDAIEVGERAIAIGVELGNASLTATARFYVATALHVRGDFRKAEAHCRDSYAPLRGELTAEYARTLTRYQIGARMWLLWSLESLGELTEAVAIGRESVEIVRLRGERFVEIVAAAFLGLVLIARGDWHEAIAALEPALANCRTYHVGDFLSPVPMHLGYAYSYAGRLDEGIRLQEEGAAHAEAIQGYTGYTLRLAQLALCYLLGDRHGEAEATARRGLALARELPQPPGEAACLHALGAVLTKADSLDFAEAHTALQQALERATALEMRLLVAHCHLDLARLHRRAEDSVSARAHLSTALAMYREIDMPFWIAETEREAASRP